jgi:myo-inositol-1(or 4)-monophosphatase
MPDHDDASAAVSPVDDATAGRAADPDLTEPLLELAEELGREAGELIERMRAEIDLAGETKSSSTDVVTAADRASEALIIDRLEELRPGDGILGEEGGKRESSTGVRWLIDPIDGTTNYVYDVPAYSVSIAAEIDGVLAVGVVYEPQFDRCYSARIGGGARLTRPGRSPEQLSVNRDVDLASALIGTGFGYLPERRRAQAEILVELLPEVRDIRRFGSAALDLCFLAEGQLDAYFEKGLNPWDLAAGTVIAREAGAVVGDLRGGPPSEHFTIAANGRLFETLVVRLRELGADSIP